MFNTKLAPKGFMPITMNLQFANKYKIKQWLCSENRQEYSQMKAKPKDRG